MLRQAHGLLVPLWFSYQINWVKKVKKALSRSRVTELGIQWAETHFQVRRRQKKFEASPELESLPNLHLLSFGDRSCAEARARLKHQAEESGYFKSISILSEDDLSADFRRNFQRILRPGSRGFGYWTWKPQVVMERLIQISDGEVLLYIDVGCHIVPGQRQGIMRYLDRVMMSPSGVLCSELPFPERQYTKGDVFNFLGVAGESSILDSGQRQGGVVFYRKCAQSLDFVQRWKEVCHRNLNLVDDTVSEHRNADDFVEHRHDQSIFSVLSKLHGVDTFPDAEIMQWAVNDSDRLNGSFPIEARRDRYQTPYLQRMVARLGKRIFPR